MQYEATIQILIILAGLAESALLAQLLVLMAGKWQMYSFGIQV
jgi:hypothetical protein